MNESLISMIVPIYKAEEYLERCIESILVQTYSKWELLLVNDGSPDRCNQICQSYLEKDERIRYFEQQNQGVSVARNLGIENAKGDILIFIDADDWIEKDMCQTIIKHWDESLELLLFDYREAYSDGKRIHRHFFQKKCINFQSDSKYNLDYLMLSLMRFYQDWDKGSIHTIAVPWSRAYSRKFIVNNNLHFPPGIYMNEDRIFNLQCVEKIKNVMYVDYPLYNYFVNDKSISSTMHCNDVSRMINNYNRVFKKLEKIIKNKKDTRYLEAYEHYIILTISEIIWYKAFEKDFFIRKKYHDFYKNYVKNIKYSDLKKFSFKERLIYVCCRSGLVGVLELYAWLRQTLLC